MPMRYIKEGYLKASHYLSKKQKALTGFLQQTKLTVILRNLLIWVNLITWVLSNVGVLTGFISRNREEQEMFSKTH